MEQRHLEMSLFIQPFVALVTKRKVTEGNTAKCLIIAIQGIPIFRPEFAFTKLELHKLCDGKLLTKYALSFYAGVGGLESVINLALNFLGLQTNHYGVALNLD